MIRHTPGEVKALNKKNQKELKILVNYLSVPREASSKRIIISIISFELHYYFLSLVHKILFFTILSLITGHLL